MNDEKNGLRAKIKGLLEGHSDRDRFFDFLDRSEAVDLSQLVGYIDDSDYSLADWVEAFLGFDDWLANQDIKRRSFIDMLGYLHCCQMVIPETLERPNLQSVVIQCLSDHGFEAA